MTDSTPAENSAKKETTESKTPPERPGGKRKQASSNSPKKSRPAESGRADIKTAAAKSDSVSSPAASSPEKKAKAESQKNYRQKSRGTKSVKSTTAAAAKTEKNKKTANAKVPKGKAKKPAATAGRKPASRPAKPVAKLLINAEEPEECRIALLEDGKVESFHVTTVLRENTRGNIYKGRIVAIEPSLQAVFVDIGQPKNGFLHFGEIHPEYYDADTDAKKHWKDLKIQKVIRKGQEVLVQVVKEATASKGANITTYLSMPGRYLVLMPGSDSAGISRKIEDEDQRARLRQMMNSFNIPEAIGYIIRTASKDITKTAISQDLKFLLRLWREIKKSGQSEPTPSLLYKDQDIIAKFLRDHFTPDIEEILVDSQDAYDQVANFLKLLPAKQRKTTVRLHNGSRPIFNQYNVEDQIEQMYQASVPLPSGGSIVINPTEALVAIDVNSGRTNKDKNFEESIFLANMEAAAEMARQLRLRDLGGLIVVDFIDMRSIRHIREVEKQVRASMKRDKAKVDISRISKFGLLQISRQKMGAPIQMGSYITCRHCHGKGVVRSAETQSLSYLRRIQTGVISQKVKKVTCRLPMAVAQYLLNQKREELLDLEKRYEVEISVESAPEMNPEDNQIDFIKE